MNKLRRKTLQKIFDQLSDLREEIEAVKEEEDGSRENMPENLQGSERYERSETASSSGRRILPAPSGRPPRVTSKAASPLR